MGRCGAGPGELYKIWGSPYIYTVAEASDFKFGTQLGFAKDHNEITPTGKSKYGLGLGKLPNILCFYFNMYTMTEVRDFKFGTQLGFAQAYHRTRPEKKWAWPWVREASIYLGFLFNISATSALSS